jgi:hypothetical protein
MLQLVNVAKRQGHAFAIAAFMNTMLGTPEYLTSRQVCIPNLTLSKAPQQVVKQPYIQVSCSVPDFTNQRSLRNMYLKSVSSREPQTQF